jgi:hypothetical protein
MKISKKLKVPIYSFFKVRTPFYITSKKVRILLAKQRLKKKLIGSKENRELIQLLNDGMVLSKNVIDDVTVKNWISRYKIFSDSFIECEGNISFPFFNSELSDLLFNSDFLNNLYSYFDLVYGKKAVLQAMPTLVITKPKITQDNFTSSEYNFPAAWHTDYISEFTIHIPLTNIDNLTNHTKYILKSHTNFLIPPLGARKVNESNKIDCFAKVGDALFIDVDGWHRAQLEKGSFRAMIQLKYTLGNDQLEYDPDNSKQMAAINRSKKHTLNYTNLKSVLEEDYRYFKSHSPDFGSNNINLSLDLAYKSL